MPLIREKLTPPRSNAGMVFNEEMGRYGYLSHTSEYPHNLPLSLSNVPKKQHSGDEHDSIECLNSSIDKGTGFPGYPFRLSV